MLMVILGAGASFDSCSDRADAAFSGGRPPLANDLFHDTYKRFREPFPQLQGIIPELIPKPRRSLETALSLIQQDSQRNPTRRSQLMAVRYYLQTLLDVVPTEWLADIGGFTNYDALI